MREALEMLERTEEDKQRYCKFEGHKVAIKESLDKLDKKCQKQQRQDRDGPNPRSSHSNNALFETISGPATGRHSVASSPVPCGTVLLEEDPLVSLLNPDRTADLLRFCSNCMEPAGWGRLHCAGCSSAAYCSARCREEASYW